MTKSFRTFAAIAILAIMAGIVAAGMEVRSAGASTLGFITPKIATSSTMQVGPQQVKQIATSSRNCYSRVIGAVNSPLQLSFSISVTPTGTIGYVQAASTTVPYTNGDYGCGPIWIYAYSSTTITVSEFSQL